VICLKEIDVRWQRHAVRLGNFYCLFNRPLITASVFSPLDLGRLARDAEESSCHRDLAALGDRKPMPCKKW